MEIRTEQDRTLKDLSPNVAALLCYVAGWISGIVFLVLEQKNRFVRFHALQSIIVFATLMVAGAILGHMPIAGPVFSTLIGLTGFVLWIILMIKAYNGEFFKLPWAGDLAEKLTKESMKTPASTPPQVKTTIPPDSASSSTSTAPPEPITPVSTLKRNGAAKAEAFKDRYYSYSARSGRIAGSAVAIAWSIALLVFFNYYHQYIAYYQSMQIDGATQWQMFTLVTADFNAWLPILNTTLALTIVGHACLIAFDKYLLRKTVRIILDIFGIATVVTLLSIYPFNFDVIPNADAAFWAQVGTTVTLIIVAVGFGIGALVKFIQLIVHAVDGRY